MVWLADIFYLSNLQLGWPEDITKREILDVVEKLNCMGITEYDPNSVMHYTIPQSWLLNPKLAVLHRNEFLSAGDKKHAILCYGPKNDSGGTGSKYGNALTISPSSSSYDSLSLSFTLF